MIRWTAFVTTVGRTKRFIISKDPTDALFRQNGEPYVNMPERRGDEWSFLMVRLLRRLVRPTA